MLTEPEKTVMNQSVFDLIADYLGGKNFAVQYIDIFESVKAVLYNADQISDWDLSAIIDRHLNTLITDHLVEISTGKKMAVLFAYVTY